MDIKLENVSKKYGDKTIFSSLSFTFKENKITCLMGPSGIGKTTLVRMIAGLTPFQGNITKPNAISYIFQEARLINNLTVYENLDYVIKNIYKDKNERKQIIENTLKKVELLEYASFYPNQLSGGMAQRVSIARAFIYPSSLLIMDEPFKQLDEELRTKVIKEFLKLLKENKKTVIYITHDIEEAKLLTNNIYIIKNESEITKNNKQKNLI
ncbi:MAG: ABC transporter ATP-binding protein [Erysipelotrichaceae bacterium]|nr:ABC transporter ATP-binding protein [Erysipelotrichaceae bacterium]